MATPSDSPEKDYVAVSDSSIWYNRAPENIQSCQHVTPPWGDDIRVEPAHLQKSDATSHVLLILGGALAGAALFAMVEFGHNQRPVRELGASSILGALLGSVSVGMLIWTRAIFSHNLTSHESARGPGRADHRQIH